ncbi:RluA family pseudouridine synthase [Octadecabacter sp. CECT 8868]|uniref:RluA family pseudouridine synthase n=1 Tax=Octadecabacter algicola TaxID=2909342 RepID=UPI001F41CAFE|nr:RluA family pseudouridine synthase [Octadecabacter algicola]MCF2905648.1 RluA family pseudouridine synthase [Octadecabacter algicola]
MSRVQTLTIGPDEGDQRLDRWMKRRFSHLQQGGIEKMCRKGEIRVDGGRVKSNTRVEVGQKVRIPPLPDPNQVEDRPRDMKKADIELIQGCVIYKDDHVIALNKPAGLPTQGGSKQTRHVDGFAEALKFGYDEKPRLVHRLDKDTSGVLILARTRMAAKSLTEAFRHRNTEKIYWALVAGVPIPKLGSIKYGLVKQGGHGAKGDNERMKCVHPRDVDKVPGAKRAHTDYTVLTSLADRTAWVALTPVTGRTHQLRAHMAEIGHPIIGDGKYGTANVQDNPGDGWGAGMGEEIGRKLHLHARSLRIEHPATGKELWIKASLPPHMENSWKFFGWAENHAPDNPFEGLL